MRGGSEGAKGGKRANGGIYGGNRGEGEAGKVRLGEVIRMGRKRHLGGETEVRDGRWIR